MFKKIPKPITDMRGLKQTDKDRYHSKFFLYKTTAGQLNFSNNPWTEFNQLYMIVSSLTRRLRENGCFSRGTLKRWERHFSSTTWEPLNEPTAPRCPEWSFVSAVIFNQGGGHSIKFPLFFETKVARKQLYRVPVVTAEAAGVRRASKAQFLGDQIALS